MCNLHMFFTSLISSDLGISKNCLQFSTITKSLEMKQVKNRCKLHMFFHFCYFDRICYFYIFSAFLNSEFIVLKNQILSMSSFSIFQNSCFLWHFHMFCMFGHFGFRGFLQNGLPEKIVKILFRQSIFQNPRNPK